MDVVRALAADYSSEYNFAQSDIQAFFNQYATSELSIGTPRGEIIASLPTQMNFIDHIMAEIPGISFEDATKMLAKAAWG